MPSENKWFLAALVVLLLLAAGGVGLYFRHLQSSQRNDALVKAANDGNLTRVQELLDAGADPNARGSQVNTETALMRAAANGHANVAELLLDRGADVNARHEGEGDYHGRTALMFAVAHRQDLKTVELLIARGAEINARDRAGRTALDIAIQSERAEVIELLKKAGARGD